MAILQTLLHPVNTPESQAMEEDHLLVTSPYTSPDHLLDLRSLQTNQQLFARALTVMEPVDEKYATRGYAEAFNWPAVIHSLRSLSDRARYTWSRQSFYIVVFRSQVPVTTDRMKLGELDRHSHAEATKSGGLLKYWFGVPDADGRNLATCIWRASTDTKPASSGEGHKAAARATIHLYTEWKIERLRFIIGDDGAGGVGDWAIEDWEDQEGSV